MAAEKNNSQSKQTPLLIENLLEQSKKTFLDGKVKGIPQDIVGMPLQAAQQSGWSLRNEEICLPALTLSESAFAHNLHITEQYALEHGIFLCPHGKTMLSPQLLSAVLQGERTVGLSAATIAQARVMAELGSPIILIANQVVGKSNIRGLAQLIGQFPKIRFLSIVDSPAVLDMLMEHGTSSLPIDATFEILVEVGYQDARTGLQTHAQLEQMITSIQSHQNAGSPLRVAGLQAYEGSIGGTHEERKRRIPEYLGFALLSYDVLATTVGVLDQGQQPIFSAGGSSSFDFVVAAYQQHEFSVQPVMWLRGGVAATYDHLIYRERLAEMDERSGFVLGGKVVSAVEAYQPALAVWAVVQSLPQPGMAILAAGVRDFPFDAGLPVALQLYRNGTLVTAFRTGTCRISKAMDQHGYLNAPDGFDIRVGDLIKFGISHPCTAFDKWRFVFCIDDDDKVTRLVETYF